MKDDSRNSFSWVTAVAEGREPSLAPVVCAGAALLAWWGASRGWPQALQTGAWATAYLAGGIGSLIRTLESLRRKHLDVDLLMLVSAAGAAVIGELAEGAILLFLFSLSNALESQALRRTQRAIESLMDLRPDSATLLLPDGTERTVPVESLAPGQLVRLRPGERVPVDARIESGQTSINQAAISGESLPISKAEGEEIFAGSINVGGTFTAFVLRPAADSTLARIIHLVESAREAKAPTQRFIDRFEQGYAALVLFAAGAAILGPYLAGTEFHQAFYRAMTLLVVASPCAVVISTPATILSALAHAAHRGLLFKGGAPLEELAQIDVVAFDKTGTLTLGRPVVTQIIPFGTTTTDEVLTLAAAVERLSEHPLGRAIVERATADGLDIPAADSLLNTQGQGATADLGENRIAVGRKGFVAQEAPGEPLDSPAADELEAAGMTVVYTAGGGASGAIAIEDQVRPEAAAAIRALRSVGVRRTLLLTGDNSSVAARVAKAVGIDEWHAGLMPEDKVAILRRHTAAGERTAMLGDGVNDAPALATATVGIAMGVTGTHAALDTADLVLVRDELALVAYAVRLARRARRVVRQNLLFACSVIVFLVASNWIYELTLPLGVLGHEGSTLIVIANGLRLLRPLGRDAGELDPTPAGS